MPPRQAGGQPASSHLRSSTRDHHGDSLICNPRGEIIAQGSATREDVVMADVDLSVIPELRALWGYYRDRRPDLYGPVVEVPSAPSMPAARGGRA
jgi:predicted amidohydrolase